jgi:acetoin utilization deacetylase AcuC-like enzyme
MRASLSSFSAPKPDQDGLNLTLTNSSTSCSWRDALQFKILPALRAFEPELLLISTGFDGLATDPLGGKLGLSVDEYAWATRLLVHESNTTAIGGTGSSGFGSTCKRRVVSVLEGGYDIDPSTAELRQAVEAHIMELMRSVPGAGGEGVLERR